MTRKELQNYFSDPMFNTLKYAIDSIMASHPEIDDRFTIEAAAEQIDECRGDGVELSVEDALRLVDGKRPPDVKELVASLAKQGITGDSLDEVAESILDMEIPRPTGEKPKASASHKARILTQYGKLLAEQNEDIVLMGVPDVDPGWDFAQLKLAFFSENLTKEQKNILENMKRFSDETKWIDKGNHAEVIFYINDLK